MTGTVRAILIDPEKRAFTEIQIADSHKKIRTALRCRSFAAGAFLNGSAEDGGDAVYVSDDYLEDRDDPMFWFQVDADRNSPSSAPIAVLGLAVGVDPEGNGRDVNIGVDELAARITFAQRDILVTMANEIDEAVELMRPHFPDSDDASLRRRAEGLRCYRYKDGHWPDFAEIARWETIEANCAAILAEMAEQEAAEAARTSPDAAADPEVSAESDVRLVIDNKAPVVDATDEGAATKET